MKWTKIDDENKPDFGKKYLLGKQKKGFFDCEEVYFGWLHEVKVTETEKRFIYKCEKKLNYGEPKYSYVADITHYIEIENLQSVK